VTLRGGPYSIILSLLHLTLANAEHGAACTAWLTLTLVNHCRQLQRDSVHIAVLALSVGITGTTANV